MQKVFVLDTEKRPLMPCHPAKARYLLRKGHAAVFRRYPFVLILKHAVPAAQVQPLRLKLDPGSKTTGIAIVHERKEEVVFAAELDHRGEQVRQNLDSRRNARRSRRQRKTRYRPARFLNRRRSQGWLPPSLHSRLGNIQTWVQRLRRYCPIGAISQELVRFDTQAIQNPEIEGIEYQQGTVFGYEIREYLLVKFGHRCIYCQKTELPLQIEHIVPKARGGTNRVTNLTLACESCNQNKGTQTAEEFGHPEVQQLAHKPLKDAAAVNSTRWALYEKLKTTGLPIETGTGGQTKYNRILRHIPKMHWLDAACVGTSTPQSLNWGNTIPLQIHARGRHDRKLCKLQTPKGRPLQMTKPKASSEVGGYRTGDMVRVIVPEHLKTAGTHVGSVKIRASGYCDIRTTSKLITGVHCQYFHPLHRADGYTYQKGEHAGEREAAS